MKQITLLLSVFSLFALFARAQVNPNFTYTQTCYGNMTTLVASSSLADASISSWQWDLNGDGIYEKSGKTIISLFTNDTVAVALKITPVAGSADSVTNNVIIDPLPSVNFMANNLCEGNTATFISLSNIAPGNITQTKWDFNNDGTDDATGDTVMYNCGPAATYVTKLTCVTNKGCSAFAMKTTTIYTNPVASFSSTNACVGSTTTFTNSSIVNNLNFYEWNFGDGNSNSTQGDASHIYSAYGTYTVQLIAVTQQGCADTTSGAVIIYPLPIVDFFADTVCYGDQTVFNDLSFIPNGNINGWSWNFGDGGNSSSQNPSYQYSNFGSFNTILSVTSNFGCTSSSTKQVIVNSLPQISISGGDTLPPSGSLQLIANGANTYLWSTSETTNAIIVSQSGTYSVKGTDVNGCSSTDSLKIYAANAEMISVSGLILTPNADGINDNLIIDNISEYSNCDLKIYNSWNDEVFSVTGYKNDWKGTNKSGNVLPAGAYYYVIKCDDKPVSKGNINILH